MVVIKSKTKKSEPILTLDCQPINAEILEWENMYKQNRRRCNDEALVAKQLDELPKLLASLESFSEF